VNDAETTDLVALTADLTSAHLSNNEVSPEQVPVLIRAIYDALAGLGNVAEPVVDKPVAAVTARKSLADPARIISMVDGKPYAALKRHLRRHGYTPESYREAFDLPDSYPMVAPGYSEQRASLAKELGFGRKGKVARGIAVAADAVVSALASAKEQLTGDTPTPPRMQLKANFGKNDA
jgi:predicted transcriptional regulator